jgi:hypothetical protein
MKGSAGAGLKGSLKKLSKGGGAGKKLGKMKTPFGARTMTGKR